MIVTFDLFSALTDSRTGGATAFDSLARQRGWAMDGEELYTRWDRHNKTLQRTADASVTFRDLSREALQRTYADLGFPDDTVVSDLTHLQRSVSDWPLWPDVAEVVRAVAAHHRVGILSNVDDDLARTTRAARLVEPELILTSQRLGAYKPNAEIYRRAESAVAPERLVHIASSGRDVRGALEAGITTIWLRRKGHVLDPDGPQPPLDVADARDLVEVLRTL